MEMLLDKLATPMVPPPAYGWFHILYTLGGFALCALAAWRLRKVSDRTARAILFTIGAVLAVSEVMKQVLCIRLSDGYPWGDFPFQLCSVPMYMCLIAPWLKPGKVQRSMYSFMVLYNLLGGAIAFAEPSGLLLDRWFFTVHALAWHMLLVFIGLFLCMSDRGGTRKGDYAGATEVFVALCALAFGMNCFVQLALDGNMNMFFVGPGDSPIVVFKQFSQWFGWYVNTFIYIGAVCLGAYIVHRIVRRSDAGDQ